MAKKGPQAKPARIKLVSAIGQTIGDRAVERDEVVAEFEAERGVDAVGLEQAIIRGFVNCVDG